MSPEEGGHRVFVAECYLDLLSRSSYLRADRDSAKRKVKKKKVSLCRVTVNTNNKDTRRWKRRNKGKFETIERK